MGSPAFGKKKQKPNNKKKGFFGTSSSGVSLETRVDPRWADVPAVSVLIPSDVAAAPDAKISPGRSPRANRENLPDHPRVPSEIKKPRKSSRKTLINISAAFLGIAGPPSVRRSNLGGVP